jgi:putative ABC transport system permease protein
MMLRNITGHPIRAMLTTLGMALATATLVASLFLTGTMEDLINVTYFMADRQDATISFVKKRPLIAVKEIARLPAVLAAEPYREVPVRIRRVMISGRPHNADLNRIIDVELHPVVLPETGLAISGWLAQILGGQVGDFIEVDLLEGQRRTVSPPVAALVEDYFGIQA